MPFVGAEIEPKDKRALFNRIVTTDAGGEQTYFADVRNSLCIEDGWSEYKLAPKGPRDVTLRGNCTILVIFGAITVGGLTKRGMKGHQVENEESITLHEKTAIVITYPR